MQVFPSDAEGKLPHVVEDERVPVIVGRRTVVAGDALRVLAVVWIARVGQVACGTEAAPMRARVGGKAFEVKIQRIATDDGNNQSIRFAELMTLTPGSSLQVNFAAC